MFDEGKNCIVVLGPTASGKTALGVRLAYALGGEVISADSRQVYRGLDVGSGKDLEEYVVEGIPVPYHLIDVVGLEQEFNVFEYQRRFFETFEHLTERGVAPVVVGGTGLYLEAVLNGYRMVEAPVDCELREELSTLSDEELEARLRSLKPRVHNVTDLGDRDRTVRAIEIAEYSSGHEPEPAPDLRPLIFGTRWERAALHGRIAARLKERLNAGLIEEVEGLLAVGVGVEKLRSLGLEYRFVTDYVKGAIKNRNDLFQKLNVAIRNFAKRQETWFRRMERNGTEIQWIAEADVERALEYACAAFPNRA